MLVFSFTIKYRVGNSLFDFLENIFDLDPFNPETRLAHQSQYSLYLKYLLKIIPGLELYRLISSLCTL